MPMYWPVVKEDFSEQSHRTASDTSRGVPKRPRGCKARARSLSSGSPKARSAMSVWHHRGADCVHADALRGTFGSGRLGQPQHATLLAM